MQACKKGGDDKKPEGGGQPPVSRPVGDAIGTAIDKSIGTAGGQLASADGSITVTVPAGALAETVNFQLQAVKNTCDAGLGTGFRLTPHGKQFTKPVTIRFSYATYLDSIASEDALSIAYQDAQGVWQMVKPFVVDKVNKTVSVTTTHFSDWALITWLKIKPVSAVLGVGETLDLQVMNYHPYTEGNLLQPLNGSDESTLPLGKGVQVPASYIKKWTLTGPGNLQGNGSAAKYTAPGAVNGQAAATAVAEIASESHTLLLLSHITVIGEGLVFRVNGGDWQFLEGQAMALDNAHASINGLGDGVALTLVWSGGVGTFQWVEGGQHPTSLAYGDEAGYQHSSYYYDGNNSFKDSPGAMVVEKWGNKGDWVTGRFQCAPAGRFSSGSQFVGTVSIDGYFRMKRIL